MNFKAILKSFIHVRWRLIVVLTTMMVGIVAIKVATPLLIRHVFDRIVVPNAFGLGLAEVNAQQIGLWVMILLLMMIAGFVLQTQRVAKSAMFGNDLTAALNKEMYSTILRSELYEFNKLDINAVSLKLTKTSSEIGNEYFAHNLIGFMYHFTLVLALQITLFIINPWFGLITFISLPLFYFVTKQLDVLMTKRDERNHSLAQEHEKVVQENLRQLKNIKVLNGIAYEESQYQQLFKQLQISDRKFQSIKTINVQMISELLTGLIMITALGIGGWAIMQTQATTIGAVVATIFIVPSIFPAFRLLMDTPVLPHHIKEKIQAINEIFELKPENRADTVQQLDEVFSLKFKDVYYEYGTNSKFELQDINFEVKKGEKLGVFGLSNSGKTTLFDLITKITRPKQGNVLINNCDLNKVNTYYLRELISAVPQHHRLFTETIEKNITYPLAFDEYQYNDALNKCRLKSLIYSLEKKDKTIISEDSTLLTTAEKQKIALANAIYKDAKIFLLDDATSKMGQAIETDIINEVYKLKNKIIIVISNRIHNLMKCDKIMILNNGRIIEYGKTKELLDDQKSTFARMMKEYESSKSRVG